MHVTYIPCHTKAELCSKMKQLSEAPEGEVRPAGCLARSVPSTPRSELTHPHPSIRTQSAGAVLPRGHDLQQGDERHHDRRGELELLVGWSAGGGGACPALTPSSIHVRHHHLHHHAVRRLRDVGQAEEDQPDQRLVEALVLSARGDGAHQGRLRRVHPRPPLPPPVRFGRGGLDRVPCACMGLT